MKRLIFVLFVIFVLSGCASVQFKEEPYVLIGDVDADFVRENFLRKAALNFETVGNFAFYYWYQGFAGIGLTKVSEKDDSFAVAGFNPGGFKLFELTGSTENHKEIYFQNQFKKHGDAAGVIAGDMRKIYFRRIPSAEASVEKGKRKIVFTEPFEDGKIEYIFAGQDKYLVEKIYKKRGRKEWTVFYADYRENNGKVHPWSILLKNHKYGYNLKFDTKEFNI